ncbi:hypothetical protein C2I18_00790 [Paenibacillus sp. PK3_47]|uniref:DUF2207 domain-containing protein n=1 Tax=Paenibacillus sp. PK3_47 TaxID=2072642 RepID=UPI00201DEF55|nr:DUF2207 domain-containing protein [Paenibacillus sp. PK3_47]UQZ32210.1 hypothetical protein C2I18_00790 [Paenibacillus sp. PK3_47]
MKKYFMALTLSIIFFIAAVPVADARSYSIDEVQIRAWIQPDGDLLVNEIFTYNFKGKYDRVKRFIHEEHHSGVSNFEAYELSNPSAGLGFVKQEELHQLSVTQEGNGYYSSLPADDETKYIFYTYTLQQAVSSYETYSDLTVPFFGEGSNHDQDYQNVTIDFVFPEQVDPGEYYAFIHDANGIVEQKGAEVVRFTTPVSEMYSLTGTRLLFPSEIMSSQTKTTAPVSLEAAVAEENRYMQSMAVKEQRKAELGLLLIALAILAAAVSVIMLLLPQRRKGSGNPDELLAEDPLRLYVLGRLGKRDFNAFVAGLYSLVEKGFASVTLINAYSRFLKDPQAPDQSLQFTLTADLHLLSESESKLVEALFKRRNGKRSFLLNDLAGATRQEKEEKISFNKYIYKIQAFKVKEQQWWNDVISGMIAEGDMSNRVPRLLKGGLPVLAIAAMLYAYFLDSFDVWSIVISGMIGLLLWWTMLGKPGKHWPVFVFWGAAVVGAMIVQDADLMLRMFLFIIACIVLISVTPRMILSRETAALYRSVKLFRKQMSRGEIPVYDLEKWMIRSQLLRAKPQAEPAAPSMELAAAAPLAYLMLSGQNPVTYMEESWKMTLPYASSSSGPGGSGYSGDSGSYGGGYSGSDSGGGGGDGGGGAGAD